MKRFKKFGTALLSCMMLTASFTTVSNMTMITAEAHQGRTDAQGGHHDYKNKSGLGSYHYHCGGHEAHLHPNGVCPYKNGAVSNGNTSSQTQTQAASNQNAEQMSIYQPVFDANYYYTNNLDLQSTIGWMPRSYLSIFIHAAWQRGVKHRRISMSAYIRRIIRIWQRCLEMI